MALIVRVPKVSLEGRRRERRVSFSRARLFVWASILLTSLASTRLWRTTSSSMTLYQQETPELATNNTVVSVPHNNGSVCDGYKGVLLISQGDPASAAGTVFFQYVINHILLAEQTNLLPFVHLNDVSKPIYDPIVHESDITTNVTMLKGLQILPKRYKDPDRRYPYRYPGKLTQQAGLTPHTFQIQGDGVWEHYFQPISTFQMGDCPHVPLVTLSNWETAVGLHDNAPFGVRAWRQANLPTRLLSPNVTLLEWYRPQRQRAHRVVQQYFRFQPHLLQLSTQALPLDNQCLGLHVRHSDKTDGRERIPLSDFKPYVQAYIQAKMGKNVCFYLATDSTAVLQEWKETWPNEWTQHLYVQPDTLRSKDEEAVFNQHGHHITNTQVLVDILALSRCRFFLHGWSAVSEAVIYINLELHTHGVDLEDTAEDRMSVADFETLVRNVTQEQEPI